MERTPNKSQYTKLTLETKIFPRSHRDSNSQPFDRESGALTNKPSRLTQLNGSLFTETGMAHNDTDSNGSPLSPAVMDYSNTDKRLVVHFYRYDLR